MRMNTRALSMLLGIAFVVFGLTLPARCDPFESLPDGSLRHPSSRFIFPQQIGDFTRFDPRQYDQQGLDVSASYRNRSVVATIYAYPAPASQGEDVLEREYQSKRAEVTTMHPGAVAVTEEKFALKQGGQDQSGRHAVFTFQALIRGTPTDLESQLLVFHLGSVFVEYRFTYPASDAVNARKQIDAFISAWAWRGPSA